MWTGRQLSRRDARKGRGTESCGEAGARRGRGAEACREAGARKGRGAECCEEVGAAEGLVRVPGGPHPPVLVPGLREGEV